MGINGNNSLRDLLRFTTAGSVDDGKSTLTGRLLYDSKSLFDDQLDHIAQSGKRLGKPNLDLSLLTDGLRAEREQGITIDVAYRYFTTPERKFIIADTPGHIQYTRNMVTGASTADLAVILVDAGKGVLEQTLRHSYIASLLDIRHIVFCINKMDVVCYSEEVYSGIRKDLAMLAGKLKIEDAYYIPVSAKFGDNIVDPSQNMQWYEGRTLLKLLETIEIKKKGYSSESRLPVQTVIHPDSEEYRDYRGYAGRIAGGIFCTGDEVTAMPSMLKSRITSINRMGKNLLKAGTGDSVFITLEDQLDISRGNLIAKSSELPQTDQNINLMICWFNEEPLKVGGKYLIRNYSNETSCIIKSVNYRININSLEKEISNLQVTLNEIANITIRTASPLYFDSYKKNHITGSLIFIDTGTNKTIAAGMIDTNRDSVRFQ
jgi:sulfate adenylyltransferase subunit 1